jgi:hypothetical protein
MNSFIDLMSDTDWTDDDMRNRVRSMLASVVPEARQNELRTIMLGHISGMRTATPEEMAEITLVKNTAEANTLILDQARADMALLRAAWAVEEAQRTLALPEPEDEQEAEAKAEQVAAAKDVIGKATPETLALVELRAAARAQPARAQPASEQAE